MNINNSQNATYTIMDLPKIIKIAREHTLLGRYETSLKKYQIALEIIQARKKEVNVGVLRDKWQMTELNIKSEIAQTKQMLDACIALTNIDFNYFKKQIESKEIQKKKFQEKGIMVFDICQTIIEDPDRIKIISVANHFRSTTLLNKIRLVHSKVIKLME